MKRISLAVLLATIAVTASAQVMPPPTVWVVLPSGVCVQSQTCIVTGDPIMPYVSVNYVEGDVWCCPPDNFTYDIVPYSQLHSTYAALAAQPHNKIGKQYVGESRWIVWTTPE